jgi:Skp family chaperone for outer membrane proteins
MSTGAKAVIGAGVVLAAAAAAYFLTGERGEKNRESLKAWAKKAHKEIAADLKKVERVTQAQYHAMVEKIVSKYNELDKGQAEELMNSLKEHWNEFSK